MYMYINTCEQGYQSTAFIGKYKEYLCSPNNICFEIIMSRNSYDEQAQADSYRLCLIGGSRYNSMVAKS